MRFNVRCRTCEARRVLPKHPDEYIRLPKCNTCGTSNKGYRVVRLKPTITCKCLGYYFPHRYLSPQCLDRAIAEAQGQEWRHLDTPCK